MTAPMSMEEWQNRLRAQKQQDRTNKTKSAEMLHSYQAKDENEAQKRIRESRRESLQAKKDAEENLRNYRPNAENIEALTPSKPNQSTSAFKFDHDGPLPPVVAAPTKDDPKRAIKEGAVSSIAAGFTGTGTPINMLPANNMSNSGRSTSSRMSNGPPPLDATAPNEENGSSTGGSHLSFTEIGHTQTTEVAHDWVQLSSGEIAIPGSANTKMIDANNIQSSSGSVEPANAAPNLIQEETPIPMQPETPQYKRMDVDFSFGLISTKAQPSLDAYMQAVQDVLLDALDENLGMKQVISYNAACPPFVQGIQKDDSYVDQDGRGNVQRLLVKAAVPVFLTNNSTNKKARSFVIKALAAALRQGYFLKIAEGA